MGRGKNQFEPIRLAGKEALGLARSMGRVIVEQQTDQHSQGVMRIEPLKEGNELARAMPLSEHVMHEAAHQIDRRGQRSRIKALILVVPLTVAWLPGFGGRSGAVVAIAWIPGFSS